MKKFKIRNKYMFEENQGEKTQLRSILFLATTTQGIHP